jgi:hypothetical protein
MAGSARDADPGAGMGWGGMGWDDALSGTASERAEAGLGGIAGRRSVAVKPAVAAAAQQ